MSGLNTQDHRALRLFRERVRQAFPDRVDSLHLFGSKARGDAQIDSDADVLVILAQADWRDQRQVSGIATDVLVETGVDISPKVYSREQVARMRRRRNVFLQEVVKDAVPL